MSTKEAGGRRTAGNAATQWLEYAVARFLTGVLGLLPRRVARHVGARIGAFAYWLLPRLRNTGFKNLGIAFPAEDHAWRERVLRGSYRNLGYLLAEFSCMSRYTLGDAAQFIRYEGLDHYLSARERGRGVLVLTAHLGAWELSSFFHSLAGYSMGLLIRRLDNPKVDRMVNRIRGLHGNWVVHKDDFARGLITAMRAGKTVGILMDTNMTPPQGVFVPFFGRLACTASGMARIAVRTEAAVVPGFLTSDGEGGNYTLRFGEELQLIRTADPEADILANTALFTATLERYIRQFPDQWLWMHRRWKTRPPAEKEVS